MLIKKNRQIFSYLPAASAGNKIVSSSIISSILVYATHVEVYHSLGLATATHFLATWRIIIVCAHQLRIGFSIFR